MRFNHFSKRYIHEKIDTDSFRIFAGCLRTIKKRFEMIRTPSSFGVFFCIDNIECANHRRQPVESEFQADTESDWQT